MLLNNKNITFLNMLLFLGAIVLSVIFIFTIHVLFLGGQSGVFFMSLYSGLPPYQVGVPGENIITFGTINPVKDLSYGVILGSTFLVCNWIKSKWCSIYYFLISLIALFFCHLIIIQEENNMFWLGQLICVSYFILVFITGVITLISHKKANKNIE